MQHCRYSSQLGASERRLIGNVGTHDLHVFEIHGRGSRGMLHHDHLQTLAAQVPDQSRAHESEATSNENLVHAARVRAQNARVASINRDMTSRGPIVMVAYLSHGAAHGPLTYIFCSRNAVTYALARAASRRSSSRKLPFVPIAGTSIAASKAF